MQTAIAPTNAEQRSGPRLGRPAYKECVSVTANKEQLNRPKQGKLGLHETGRLVDEKGKLKDSVSLSKSVCQL